MRPSGVLGLAQRLSRRTSSARGLQLRCTAMSTVGPRACVARAPAASVAAPVAPTLAARSGSGSSGLAAAAAAQRRLRVVAAQVLSTAAQQGE